MEEFIQQHLQETLTVIKAMNDPKFISQLTAAGETLAAAAQQRATLFIAGNGGSWADADHFAAELRAQYEIKGRVALPSMALPISLSTLTAWGNDYNDGFETAMKRDLEAMGRTGDVLVAISTSGKAKNVRAALLTAKDLGIQTIAISGNGPQSTDFGALADQHIVIPSSATAHIQEGYKAVIHVLSACMDRAAHGA